MPATDLMSIQRAPPAHTEGMPLEGPTVGDGTSDWSADTRGCSHADGSLLRDRAGGARWVRRLEHMMVGGACQVDAEREGIPLRDITRSTWVTER
ncbi:hypothetical protein E1301_Tti004051 [Triplophysa tibetana]|uniref:Uncharacterized protein n=1 Tax=Triplophysa tibetana TaxID=1572043 RepID=A0A5A9NHS7_9TELE|nr:hypothetical protein E1301_Tti004051 [Triplophysa tibetana]